VKGYFNIKGGKRIIYIIRMENTVVSKTHPFVVLFLFAKIRRK